MEMQISVSTNYQWIISRAEFNRQLLRFSFNKKNSKNL